MCPRFARAVAIYRMGNRSGAKIQKEWEKMENGPRPDMAEKWPPKWKNGPKMGFWPFFLYFSISAAIFRPFQAGGHFPFLPIFFGFLRQTGFPFCRWPPRAQPSFQFLVPGKIRMYPRSGFLAPGGNIRMYPCSGFWYRGTPAKTTLLETTLFQQFTYMGSLAKGFLRNVCEYSRKIEKNIIKKTMFFIASGKVTRCTTTLNPKAGLGLQR